MAKHPVADIRNVAFVGHGAVGKTTLSDLMLFKAGAVDPGRLRRRRQQRSGFRRRGQAP